MHTYVQYIDGFQHLGSQGSNFSDVMYLITDKNEMKGCDTQQRNSEMVPNLELEQKKRPTNNRNMISH